jgi:prepilin-type N-terminal cleavage/methylation domain-containing protein
MCSTTGKRSPQAEAGFTLIELMIALTVLMIGIVGILSMQITQLHATSYTRHAGEASMLGERKIEDLRTEVIDATCTQGAPCSATQDALGAAGGIYTVTWWHTGIKPTNVTVTVMWREGDDTSDEHTLVFETKRFE